MHQSSGTSPTGGSAAPWPRGWLWTLDLGTLTAWLIGSALVLLGAPSGALAADWLAWSLMTLGGSRRSWPRAARGSMLLLIMALALSAGTRWLVQLLGPR
ncbi:MAG: hypothetical protein M0Z54_14730 [Thermaerobacter sp.]|nr:hypothetical protein [Thermaerobacter sp.]